METEKIQNQVSEFLEGVEVEHEGWESGEIEDVDIFTPPQAPVEEGEEEEGKKPVEELGDPRQMDLPLEEEGEKKEEEKPEAKQEEKAPVVSSEIETLKEQNRLLMTKLEELITVGKPHEVVKTDHVTPSVPVTPGQIIDFVGDEDIDEILSSKEKFNAIMSKAVNMAITNSGETFIRALPSMVQNQVATQTTLKTQVDAFYNENSDLQPVKKVVGTVANEVAAENPEWEIGKIFEETAGRVRKMLGLPGVARVAETSDKPSKRPALPGAQKSGARVGNGKLTDQQKQIIDIL